MGINDTGTNDTRTNDTGTDDMGTNSGARRAPVGRFGARRAPDDTMQY